MYLCKSIRWIEQIEANQTDGNNFSQTNKKDNLLDMIQFCIRSYSLVIIK